MQSFPLNKDDVGALMLEHGITPTPQRLEIAQVLFARAQHLSAEQVLSKVNEERVHVSKATVYNTLGLFAEKGLVREVLVDRAKVFYDSNVTFHHHFYHVDSGALIDIDGHSMGLTALPELPSGTVADGVDIIIRLRDGER